MNGEVTVREDNVWNREWVKSEERRKKDEEDEIQRRVERVCLFRWWWWVIIVLALSSKALIFCKTPSDTREGIVQFNSKQSKEFTCFSVHRYLSSWTVIEGIHLVGQSMESKDRYDVHTSNISHTCAGLCLSELCFQSCDCMLYRVVCCRTSDPTCLTCAWLCSSEWTFEYILSPASKQRSSELVPNLNLCFNGNPIATSVSIDVGENQY